LSEQNNSLQSALGQTDIYLIDQILKGRFHPSQKILDAGCGSGRNMYWFLQNDFNVSGIDSNPSAIELLKKQYPSVRNRFEVAAVEQMPFSDEEFDHVISSAVLHFANSTLHFRQMFSEMVRVIKRRGMLFIRMTCDIGLEEKVIHVKDGTYYIPDGSKRFLLTRSLLNDCLEQYRLILSEPFKTVLVDDVRSMSTVVLQKC
jgi:tellurite methyltransferase